MDEKLTKKLKENLEKINGIRNVKFYRGNFRGKEKKDPYLEFNLTSDKYEINSFRLYSIMRKKIIRNFPVSIDYIIPDICANNNNLRRVILHIDDTYGLPYKKEELVKKIAREFNNIIENYLLRANER